MAERARIIMPPKRLIDFGPLLRLAIWGLATAAALAVAALSAQSNAGAQRLAMAVASLTGHGATPAPPAIRATDAEVETRRLSEAVRTVTGDLDRLLTRMAVIERNLEEVTGSVKNQSRAPATAVEPPPTSGSAPATPTAKTFAPATSAPPASAAREPMPSQPTAEPRAAPSQPSTTASPAVTGTVIIAPAEDTTDTDPAKAATRFAVDLGGAATFDGLRQLWQTTKAARPALFEGLHPLAAARESRSRAVALRLVVGPLASVDDAVRFCATLWADHQTCQPAKFVGEPFALAAPEGARKPPATATPTPTPARRPPAAPQRSSIFPFL